MKDEGGLRMRGEPLTFPASPGSDPEAQGGPGGQENEDLGEIQLGGSTHSEQTATWGLTTPSDIPQNLGSQFPFSLLRNGAPIST